MFTTGSKLFLGATAVTIVAAIVVGGSIGGSTGLMGTVGLVTVAAVFAFLAGINLYTRDGNVSAQQEGALTTSAAAQHTSGRSVWPLVTAVGAASAVTVPSWSISPRAVMRRPSTRSVQARNSISACSGVGRR